MGGKEKGEEERNGRGRFRYNVFISAVHEQMIMVAQSGRHRWDTEININMSESSKGSDQQPRKTMIRSGY